MIGRSFSHYRILEQIGAGGMGVVYRARDEELERDVAIKVLPSGTLSDDESRRRFREEALSLARLNHPNIATVHEFGSQDGIDFLVTEYISGVNLDAKIAGRPLPPKTVLAIGVQFANGLNAAHQQGLVHRDLNPGNIRITPEDRLKILDFGLARLAKPDGDMDLTAGIQKLEDTMGTLPYMAPEQLLGESGHGDIWSAGAVLKWPQAEGRCGATGRDRPNAILNRDPRGAK
jgi:serine/threonine protein kinase